MRKLVDDDGFERLRRREDQSPAEHQAALPGRASPAAPRVAKADRTSGNVEGGPVARDLGVDRDPGTLAEPRLEDAIDPIAVTAEERHVELISHLIADAGHCRAAAARMHDPKAVHLPSKADRGTVGQPAARRKLGSLTRLAVEVAADPGVAAAKELVDHLLGMSPAAAGRHWHRDDEPGVGVDRDPKPAGAWRSAKDV
jgi:hypothetical protein